MIVTVTICAVTLLKCACIAQYEDTYAQSDAAISIDYIQGKLYVQVYASWKDDYLIQVQEYTYEHRHAQTHDQ